MFRYILLAFLLLGLSNALQAQRWDDEGTGKDSGMSRADSIRMARVKYVKINMSVKIGRQKAHRAQIQFYKAGETTAAVKSSEGKASYKMDIHSEYLIKVSYPGYASKVISMNTTVPRENLLDMWPQFKFKVELVEGETTKGTLQKPYVRIKWNGDIYDFEGGVFNEDEIPAEEFAQMMDQMITEFEEEEEMIEQEAQAEREAAMAMAEKQEIEDKERAAQLEADRLKQEEENRLARETKQLNEQLDAIANKLEQFDDNLVEVNREISITENDIRGLEEIINNQALNGLTDQELLEKKQELVDKQIALLEKQQHLTDLQKNRLNIQQNKFIAMNQKLNLEAKKNGEAASMPVSLDSFEIARAKLETKSNQLVGELDQKRIELEEAGEALLAFEEKVNEAKSEEQASRVASIKSDILNVKQREADVKNAIVDLQLKEDALGDELMAINKEYSSIVDAMSDDKKSVVIQSDLDKLKVDEKLQKQNSKINRNKLEQLAKNEALLLETISRLNLESEIAEGAEMEKVKALIQAKQGELAEIEPKRNLLNGEQTKIENSISTIQSQISTKSKALSEQLAKESQEDAAIEAEELAAQKAEEQRIASEAAALKEAQANADLERRQTIENQINAKRTELGTISSDLTRLTAEIGDIESRLSDKLQIKESLVNELNQLTGIDSIQKAIDINDIDKELVQLKKQKQQALIEKNQKEISQARLNADQLVLEKELADGDVLAMDQQISGLETKQGELSAKTDGLNSALADLNDELGQVNQEGIDLQGELARAQSNLLAQQKADDEAERLRQEAAAKEEQRKANIQSEIAQLLNKKKVHVTELTSLKSTNRGLESDLTNAKGLQTSAQSAMEGKDGLELLKFKTPSIEADIQVLEADKKVKSNEIDQLTESIKSANIDVDILNKKISIADEADRASIQSELSDKLNSIKSLTSEKEVANKAINALTGKISDASNALIANNKAIDAEIQRLEKEAEADRLAQAEALRLKEEEAARVKAEKKRIAEEKKLALTQQLQSKQSDILSLEQSISSLESKEASLKQKATELKSKMDALSVSESVDEVAKIQSALDKINAEVNHLKNSIDLEDLRAQLYDKKMQKNELEQDVAIIEEQLLDVNAVVDEAAVTANLRTTYSKLKKSYNTSQNKLSQIKSELATKEADRTAKSSDLEKTKQRIASEKLAARQAEENRIKAEIAQKKRLEASIGSEITQMSSDIKDKDNEISPLQDQVNDFKGQLATLEGAPKALREEQIAKNEVTIANKMVEKSSREMAKIAKEIEQANVALARLELENRLSKDQAGSIAKKKAAIQKMKNKEKTLREKYEEWLAKVKEREAIASQKSQAVQVVMAEAKRKAAKKAAAQKKAAEEAARKEQEAIAKASKLQSQNAEKSNDRISAQLNKAKEVVEYNEKQYADGKNKVTKTFVKTREMDAVYEKKVNFRTKAVVYFKNGAMISEGEYNQEVNEFKSAWEASQSK